MKVVLDTNVFISGIVFGGYSREILEAIIEGKIILFISENIINEVKDVLQRKKFNFSLSITRQIINEIDAISEFIIPRKSHHVVMRDPDDNIIIDCAVEAKADYIITGDEDILVLKNFKDIKIVNPRDFVERYYK